MDQRFEAMTPVHSSAHSFMEPYGYQVLCSRVPVPVIIAH